MKQYLKKYWYDYLFALILVSIIALIVTLKYGYYYSTNDDIMIRNIMNGNYTGTPEAHVINVMYISGLLGRFLYMHIPGIEWFDFIMIFLHYICWLLVIARAGQQIEKKREKTVIMLLIAIVFIIVDWKYLLLNQYTILTSQLAGVSYFWMLTSIEKKGNEYWCDRGVALFLFFVALIFRKEAFLLSLPLYGLVVFYEIANATEKKKIAERFKYIFGYVSVCFALVVIVYSVESMAYGEGAWKSFSNSHNARVQIYDYTGVPAYDVYQSEYTDLKMDYSDWVAMDLYNCELVEGLSADKMEGIAQLSTQRWNENNSLPNLLKRSVFEFCKDLFENKIQPAGIFLGAMYLFSFLLCYRENDKKGFLLCGCMLLFNVTVSIYLIARARFLERVSYGMYFQQILFLMAYLLPHAKRFFQDLANKKIWAGICFIICIGLFGVSGIYTWQNVSEERLEVIKDAKDWQYVNDYFANHPENRYCIDTKSFVFSTEKLFANDVESENMVRLGGWILNSPLQEKRMDNQNIENLSQQMLIEDSFYIVQAADKDLGWISNIWESRGYEIDIVITDMVETPSGREFAIIQLQ